MPSRIANVWAAPCEECGAQTNAPCRDRRSTSRWTRYLFGRRTHPSRARAVKAMGPVVNQPQDHLRPIRYKNGGYIKPVQYQTVSTGPTFQWYNPPKEGWINMASISTTATITVRDELWNGWVVGNTTTGTSTMITDEQMVRFEGEGIHWNTIQAMPANTYTYANLQQEQVYQRWQVIHENMIQVGEAAHAAAQRIADGQQRMREQMARQRLERQQREEQLIEQRLMAHARGLELLDMILTPEQRIQRRADGRIQVTGSDGGRWVVNTGRRSVHGNVYEVDAHGCHLGTICIAPIMRVAEGALPLSDGWVGQILAIQSDEAEFRAKGNWSGRRECQHPDVPILERAA